MYISLPPLPYVPGNLNTQGYIFIYLFIYLFIYIYIYIHMYINIYI